ncbi:hypothetical protein BG011_008204 [Mortierella polycephala]|uniref:N-acetyltransferase domain-containing protein n=1 Tax=Mortierella polycephala TaxID=41804 RepID=A0A9P6PQC5_9FUNG|nr:hypothetical protein BG011_008204 [Mortierella polycephala]
MAAINKEAIRIRPYTKDDYDQVASILYAGFSIVSDRQFKHTVKHYTTALSILLKSVIYTTLIELALLAYDNLSTLSSMETIHTLQESLMKPESAQDLILQFIKPSFLILWVFVTIVVALTTLVATYKQLTGTLADYIQGSFEDDLADIPAYYQSSQTAGKNKSKKNRSQFWVACLESHPDIVMGCVALDDLSAHVEQLKKKHLKEGGTESSFEIPKESDSELRRLSVNINYRRLGISKLLLQKLESHAKEQGFKRIILSSTLYQKEALAGYIRFGFEKEKILKLSKFFSIWCGALNLKATLKEKEDQKRRQDEMIKETTMSY